MVKWWWWSSHSFYSLLGVPLISSKGNQPNCLSLPAPITFLSSACLTWPGIINSYIFFIVLKCDREFLCKFSWFETVIIYIYIIYMFSNLFIHLYYLFFFTQSTFSSVYVILVCNMYYWTQSVVLLVICQLDCSMRHMYSMAAFSRITWTDYRSCFC